MNEPIEAPKPLFAEGDEVRLTMTQLDLDRQQVPHGALGRVVGPIDEEGSRFEVEFFDFEGIQLDDDEPISVLAHVPVAFLQSTAPPQTPEEVAELSEKDEETRA